MRQNVGVIIDRQSRTHPEGDSDSTKVRSKIIIDAVSQVLDSRYLLSYMHLSRVFTYIVYLYSLVTLQ